MPRWFMLPRVMRPLLTTIEPKDHPGDTRSPLTTCCQNGPATILWQETTGGRGMRRADRLCQIIQELRRRKLFTARQRAEALEVSERNIVRDITYTASSMVVITVESDARHASH